MTVNWEGLARRVGSLRDDGQQSGSGELAKRAIAHLLGEQTMCEAVDHCIGWKPGDALANSVLRLLRPVIAIDYCRELINAEGGREDQTRAAALLENIADRRALDWVAGFLAHENENVAYFAGVGVIDRLLLDQDIDLDEARPYLHLAFKSKIEKVRRRAAWLIAANTEEAPLRARALGPLFAEGLEFSLIGDPPLGFGARILLEFDDGTSSWLIIEDRDNGRLGINCGNDDFEVVALGSGRYRFSYTRAISAERLATCRATFQNAEIKWRD